MIALSILDSIHFVVRGFFTASHFIFYRSTLNNIKLQAKVGLEDVAYFGVVVGSPWERVGGGPVEADLAGYVDMVYTGGMLWDGGEAATEIGVLSLANQAAARLPFVWLHSVLK